MTKGKQDLGLFLVVGIPIIISDLCKASYLWKLQHILSNQGKELKITNDCRRKLSRKSLDVLHVFIEGIVQKKQRKNSYKAATEDDEIEMGALQQHQGAPEHSHYDHVDSNHIGTITEIPVEDCTTLSFTVPQVHHPPNQERKKMRARLDGSMPSMHPSHRLRHFSGDTVSSGDVFGDSGSHHGMLLKRSRWQYRKNLIVLSISFILIFTAFRSIQNLQSSLNTSGRLGVIAMACVHGTMFLTCLFAPVLINKLTSKWTIVLGLLFYLFWIVANFYPHFYTLIPTSIGVGFGQSLAWGAQITYIQKLAVDYAHLSRELTHQELSKFNGIFLACFQTTHIWGNVISSVMLASLSYTPAPHGANNNVANDGFGNTFPDAEFPDLPENFENPGLPPHPDYNTTEYGAKPGPPGGGNFPPGEAPGGMLPEGALGEGANGIAYNEMPGGPDGSPGKGPPDAMQSLGPVMEGAETDMSENGNPISAPGDSSGPVPGPPDMSGLIPLDGGPPGGYGNDEAGYEDAMGNSLLCGIYDKCSERVPYVWNISKTGKKIYLPWYL